MKKFRVISDLHLDINHDFPLKIKKDDIFTVIAGDTSGEWTMVNYKCSDKNITLKFGSYSQCAEYFGKNGKNGIVEIIYDATIKKWKKSKTKEYIELEKAGILITSEKIKNGTIIKFKFFDIEKWIRKNISKGIIIAGNHIVYNKENKTIEELKNNLHKKFSINDNITFLDNSVGVMTKEVDGILFIGSTLYTDYEYINANNLKYCELKSKQEIIDMNLRIPMPKMSGTYLNDFNFGKTTEGTYKKSVFDDDYDTYWLTSKNYLLFFKRTFESIQQIVKNNKDKDIVIITHHCPSPKCISSEYIDSVLNASYISNLENFIIENDNIKCWVCGHVHHRDNFKIGNCRVIMNPLGYCRNGQFICKGEDWSFNTFVNVSDWTVETEYFNIENIKKRYESNNKKMFKLYKKYGGFFF